MNTLFYLMLVLSAIVVLTMIHAFASAKDGYQDEGGFHPGTEPTATGISAPRFLRPPTTEDSAHLPPMLVPH